MKNIYYHLDGSKPVIDCLKIKLFRNHCVCCFKLNLFTLTQSANKRKKTEKNQNKLTLTSSDATEQQKHHSLFVIVILD